MNNWKELTFRDKFHVVFSVALNLIFAWQLDFFWIVGMSFCSQYWFGWNGFYTFWTLLIVDIIAICYRIHKAWKIYKLEQIQKKVIAGLQDLKNEILSKTLNHNETKPL